MAAPHRFEPGELLAGKYRLRRLLAAGGMGQVWVARNEATGADVALKVLRRGVAEVGEERQLEERLRQEARLSAMLAHRSIVRVFDLVEQDGSLVLVMELLRGETLHDYLLRLGPRPADEAVALVTPILGALAHAHDLGLLHRDVTPANIFLSLDPDRHVAPKLVDFGIAKAEGTPSPVQTVAGDVLGTPRYVAPERIRGAADIDGRADLFSVGVVLYEILSGVSPFAASTAAASLAAVLERTVDPDPSIDPRLWLELRRVLSKQPYERHGSARELLVALRDALGLREADFEARVQSIAPVVAQPSEPDAAGPPVSAPSQVSLDAGAARRGRGPSARAVVAAGVAVVAVGVALVLARGSRGPGEDASTPGASSGIAPAAPPPASLASVSFPGLEPSTALPTSSSSAAGATAVAPVLTPATTAPRPRPGGRPRPVATTPGF
jgi:serine/threonine-protein kinase